MWEFLGLADFWVAVAGFLALIAQVHRSNVRTRNEIREEVRDLRRMMVRHLEDHPKRLWP